MKKVLFLMVLIFLSNQFIYSQNLGDNSQLVKYFVEDTFNKNKKADLLKYGELQFEFDIIYDDLDNIKEIIAYKKNEVFIDLKAKSDITIHYEFENNNLLRVVTNFHNLSVEFLRKRFDEIYGQRKFDVNLYFSSDYLSYRYVFWDSDNNNVASIALVKYDQIEFEKAFNKEFAETISQSQKGSISSQDKIGQLRKNYFNIDDYIDNYSTRMTPSIEVALVKLFKEDLDNSIGYDYKGVQKISSNCKIRFYTERKGLYGGGSSGIDINCDQLEMKYKNLIRNIRLKLPVVSETFQGGEYNLNREFYMDCVINLSRGVIEIRKKRRDEIEFISSNSLSDTQKEWVYDKMISNNPGKYRIKYQFGTINNINSNAMLMEK